MKVYVKCFGFRPRRDPNKKTALDEMAGGSILVDLPSQARVKDLIEKMVEDQGKEDQKMIESATILINQERADLNTFLRDEDHVLVLVPLGGG